MEVWRRIKQPRASSLWKLPLWVPTRFGRWGLDERKWRKFGLNEFVKDEILGFGRRRRNCSGELHCCSRSFVAAIVEILERNTVGT